jgi:hypothetical protein
MATLDTKTIDEHIKRLQQLKSFMADPLTAQLVNELISSKNGHSSDDPVSPDDKPEVRKGDFVAKIGEVCEQFPDTQRFTVNDVIKAYEKRGYIFAARDKNVSTYSALKRLVGKSIKIASKGSGRNPTKYQRIQRFPREVTAVLRETA